jgi:DNA-binding NtrC family response regulator
MRLGDLPLLVHHFVEKAAQALGKPAPAVPRALFQLLKTYSFPGNVREVEALVFDAVARHQGATLSLQSFKEATGAPQLPESQPQADGSDGALAALFPDPLPTLRETEEALVAEALRRADGNQGVAAGLLGISRQALNKRLTRRKTAASVADLDPDGE